MDEMEKVGAGDKIISFFCLIMAKKHIETVKKMSRFIYLDCGAKE